MTRYLAALLALAPITAPAEPAATAHPAEMMQYAATVFSAGDQEEGVFWFYLGQLRYRAYLTANPDTDPSGDPAVFSSLMATLGPAINEWAFGDIPQLAGTIDSVLDFDARNPDPSLPGWAVQETRAGLQDMRDQILAQEAEIQAQREANGLANR
jgi:hypothetical protein